MGHQQNTSKNKKEFSEKNNKIIELEKEVELGLWIQVLGQIIEIKGLSGLLHLENDSDITGEQQILTGVWIKTIGQILEALSVSSQIRETDIIKIRQEQKVAITGDLLASIGAAYEAIGGIRVLEEERVKTPRIIP